MVLMNSTISGKADGLYTAAQAIPANTVIDSTYLTAAPEGGLNALSDQIGTLAKKEYTYWASSYGSADDVALPSSWNELYILFQVDANNTQFHALNIPKAAVPSSGERMFTGGHYYSATNNSFVRANYKASTNKLDFSLYTDGAASSRGAYNIYIYYR